MQQALGLYPLWAVKGHLNWTHVLKGPSPHSGTTLTRVVRGAGGRAGRCSPEDARLCLGARPAFVTGRGGHAGADAPGLPSEQHPPHWPSTPSSSASA